MASSQGSMGDAREPSDQASQAGATWEDLAAAGPSAAMEPGWRAVRALVQVRGDDLLTVMLRSSFRPVRDAELVQVTPCPYCLDGGLRTAGTVRGHKGRAVVRACDTCAAVEIGGRRLRRPRQGR